MKFETFRKLVMMFVEGEITKAELESLSTLESNSEIITALREHGVWTRFGSCCRPAGAHTEDIRGEIHISPHQITIKVKEETR